MKEQMSHIKGKRNTFLVEKSLLILLGAYLVIGALRTTSLEYRVIPFFTGAIATGVVAIIAIKFFLFHVYSGKEIALCATISTIAVAVALRNHHDTLVMICLLSIASKGVDFRKIVLIQMIAVTEVLFFSVVLSQSGVSADFGYLKSGSPVVTFGVSTATDFASYILFLALGYFFLRGEQITFLEVVLFAAGSFWIYTQTQARTAFFALLICCFLIVLYKTLAHFSGDRLSTSGPSMWMRLLGIVIMPTLSLIMLGLSFLYSGHNEQLEMINGVLTNRIRLGHIGLERYGIRLFGNNVIEHGYGFGEQPDWREGYFFLDSSYIRLLLIDGIFVYLVVMFVYMCIYKKMLVEKKYMGVIVYIVLAIACLTEQHLLEPWYNTLTFGYLAQVLPSREVKSGDEYEKPCSRFIIKNWFYLLFAAAVLVALLLSVDFHLDGSSVTPGVYSIYGSEYPSSFVFECDTNKPQQVFMAEANPDEETVVNDFSLVLLGDKEYFVEDDAGNRLTPREGKLVMTEPFTENAESQKWKILRSMHSQYFTITNVENGLSLYVEETGTLQYGARSEDTKQFLFKFIPITK